jgi:integrase/recombinase XerD
MGRAQPDSLRPSLLLRRYTGPGNRAEIPERIVYARTPLKLPDILSADEVVRFLEAVSSLKARAALTTAYAAGLRAWEAVSLKVADIDRDRMLIQVHHN